MRYLRPALRSGAFAASLGAVLLLLGLASSAPAQSQDPVERIKKALPSNIFAEADAIKSRQKELDKAIAELSTPAQLRRALELAEWTDAEYTSLPGGPEISAVDRAARKKIADKLKGWIADAVDHGDSTSQLAAATLVGEIGSTIRALTSDFDVIELSIYRDPHGFGRSLAPYLVALIAKKGEPLVRQQAAWAMGKINPDPKVAVPALAALLKSNDVADRLAASDALASMVSNLSALRKAGRVQSGVDVNREDIVKLAADVVPAAATKATAPEPDAEVRRNCLKAITQAAIAFDELIPDPRDVNKLLSSGRPLSEGEKKTVKEFEEVNRIANKLFPRLIVSLQKQGNVLAAGLEDPEERNRVQARRALEWIARLRSALLALPDAIKAGARAPDPMLDALEPSLKVFGRRLIDPDVNVRRASLDFLEQMESAIGPALPAVQRALKDPDRFIRWAAARTLREIGQKNIDASAAKTVPLLANLLGPDEDPDVREAAAMTLRRYGDLSRPALPALIAAVDYGELEQRDSLIKAIQAIAGPEGREAVPALRKALASTNVAVRKAACEALGSMGKTAAPAVAELRLRLQDDDSGVRLAASDALLVITRPKQ
jgi:HEAT repeat protein